MTTPNLAALAVVRFWLVLTDSIVDSCQVQGYCFY